MREFVKLFREGDRFGIQTNATDEDQFVRQTSVMLGEALENVKLNVRRDELLSDVLPQIIDICASLRGYKAPLVDRQVLLTTGRFYPSDSLLVAASEGNGIAKLPEVVEA